MPFKSEEQRRYLWANEPEIARDWTDTYGSRIQKNNGGIMSMQGGMKNYLGEQPMVNAPKYWQSRPDKPQTELAYITEDEKNLIMDADIHGSLRPNVRGFDGPNEGPSGIMSLDYQGDKGTYGQAGQSYGDRERPGQSSVDTGRTSHHPGVGPTKTSTKTVSPKDHFEQSWTGQPGFLGLGGGYKTLKTPGDTSAGHRSSFNPLGMMLGFINPALGMAVKGFQGLQNLGTKYGTKMGDWREKFTGYRTQDEWERARQNRINEKRISNILGRKAPITEAMQERLASLGYTGDMPEVGSTGLSRTIADDYSLEDTLRELPITSNRIKEIQNSWDSGIVGTPQGMDLAGARRAMTQPYTVSGPNRDFEIDPYQESFLSPDRNSMFTTNIYESPQGIETLNPSDLPEEFQDMATYASASAPGNNFLYNTGNPYKDNLYNEDGEYDPYSIKEIAT